MSRSIFLPLSQAAGFDVEVEAILKGGYTLERFANPDDEKGALVAEALDIKNKGRYDFVILQEQSLRPIKDRERFFGGVRALAEKITALGATPVLYSTWGRKRGSPDLTELNMTNESMTFALAAAYRAIGTELGIPVAEVGFAFYDVYNNRSDIELYDPDFYHPIYAGSYLAAATLFAKIFNVDPVSVEYSGELDEDQALVLRRGARDAVFFPPTIPDNYVMNS